MKKKTKIILASILSVLILLGAIFWAYTANYYHADNTAITVLNNDATILKNGKQIVLPGTSDTGIIFYPGAKVEESAYLPLLENLQEQGITCVVVKMPFHLAIFNQNAADSVFENFPAISNWYIAGHSLGGAMASSYFSKNTDKLSGLILLGAYVYGKDVPLDDVAILYGSNDLVLNREKLDQPVVNTHVIEGGNHAYFGNYGEQAGDGVATITREQQQTEAADYILNFIAQKSA